MGTLLSIVFAVISISLGRTPEGFQKPCRAPVEPF